LTGEWKRELEFVGKVLGGLEGDAKNYHTWSYRQWILGYFTGDRDVWLGELPFVDEMLSHDVRNNSAWHHRYFVVWGSGIREGEEDRGQVLSRELTYVKQKISLAPNNPSAWNYLRGVLHVIGTPLFSLLEFVEPYTRPQPPKDIETDVIVDLDNPLPNESAQLPCVEALEFLADVHEAQTEEVGVEAAVSIWKSLADEYDPIRKNYWQYRIRTVQRTQI